MAGLKMRRVAIAALCLVVASPIRGYAAGNDTARVEQIVTNVVQPLMQRYAIPGMAVGIISNGQDRVSDYGVASKQTGRPITQDTLFEIGSVSKTFTATIAAYAQVTGKLTLTDAASEYLPALRGTAFDKISPLNLATYTSGGLPLQVPDGIVNDDRLDQRFCHLRRVLTKTPDRHRPVGQQKLSDQSPCDSRL